MPVLGHPCASVLIIPVLIADPLSLAFSLSLCVRARVCVCVPQYGTVLTRYSCVICSVRYHSTELSRSVTLYIHDSPSRPGTPRSSHLYLCLCLCLCLSCVRLVSCHISLDLPNLALPSPTSLSTLPFIGTRHLLFVFSHSLVRSNCIRYRRDDLLSPHVTLFIHPLFSLYSLHLLASLSFSQTIWPPLPPPVLHLVLRNHCMEFNFFLIPTLPCSYDVGFFRNSCGTLDFEADTTA